MRKLVVNARFEETLAGWARRRTALGAIKQGLQAGGVLPQRLQTLPQPPRGVPLPRPSRPIKGSALPVGFGPRTTPVKTTGLAPRGPIKRPLALPAATEVPPIDTNLPPLTFTPPSPDTPPVSSGGGGGATPDLTPEVQAAAEAAEAEVAEEPAPVLVVPEAPTKSNNQLLVYAGLAALAYFVFIRKV